MGRSTRTSTPRPRTMEICHRSRRMSMRAAAWRRWTKCDAAYPPLSDPKLDIDSFDVGVRYFWRSVVGCPSVPLICCSSLGARGSLLDSSITIHVGCSIHTRSREGRGVGEYV